MPDKVVRATLDPAIISGRIERVFTNFEEEGTVAGNSSRHRTPSKAVMHRASILSSEKRWNCIGYHENQCLMASWQQAAGAAIS